MDQPTVTIDGVEYAANLTTITVNNRTLTKLVVDCPADVHQALADTDTQARFNTRREIALRTLHEFTPDPTDEEVHAEMMKQRDNTKLKVSGVDVETSKGVAYYDAIASGRERKCVVTVKQNQS